MTLRPEDFEIKCPIGLDDNHEICSAGVCDVCRDDLRHQIKILKAARPDPAGLKRLIEEYVEASYRARIYAADRDDHIHVRAALYAALGIT